MDNQIVNLTIFLFKEYIHEFSDCLKSAASLSSSKLKAMFGLDGTIYYCDSRKKFPRWKSYLDELSEELSFDFSKAKNDLLDQLSAMEDIEEGENSSDASFEKGNGTDIYEKNGRINESVKKQRDTNELIESFQREKSMLTKELMPKEKKPDEMSELTGKLSSGRRS